MKMRTVIAITALIVMTGICLSAQEAATAPKLAVTKNLKIWLSADAGVSKDSSGKVSSWTSQVEPKVEMAQEYPDLQPSFKADAVNGLPALGFDGNNDCLVSRELPKDFTGDLTVLVVWGYATEQVNQGQDGVNNRIISAPTVKGSDWETGFQLTTGSKDIAKPSIAIGKYKERPQLKYLGLAGMTNPDNGTAGGFNFTGNIAEVLVYTAALSDADLASVTKYLQGKYKIAPAAK